MVAFQEGKKLSDVSTLGVGGPARYYMEVRTVEEMQETLKACQGFRFVILGKGSNCLFDDRGYNGVVILNKIDFFEEREAGVFHVGAGYSFSLLGVQTARKGWSGLEFASGIPGTVGGAVFMNAGANGMETCDCLVSVDYVTEEGELRAMAKEDLFFAYRRSGFHEMRGAIVGATFRLMRSEEARKKQIGIITYRKKTQPYGEKSAGCMFRNPEGKHAGALIEQCGLKGLSVGGAQVSGLHANFIINQGTATSGDILRLIDEIKERVKVEAAVDLESEVRYIPYE